MKRFLFALVCTVISLCQAMAEPPTGKAATMLNQVKSYLQTEGYVPTIDSDGDIKFKSEGRTYYISLQNYDNAVYIDFYTLLDISDSNIGKVRIAADKAQTSLKFARVDVVSNSTLSFDVVGYYESISTFKAMFENMLLICNMARERYIENYNE